MRVAELFAGAGGMALGFKRAGWETAWTAELADFPSRVTRHHWPHVPQYGDVSLLDGRELVAKHGPIDCLAGGSPCQDLSVAGKRAGLKGARSGLFHEQMRLWDETGADLCLWENVAGALSSHNGQDFAAVLSAFVGAPVLVPRDGWTGERSSGVVSGPAGVAAYRLLDAQYFGVAQRRLRVFVLGTRARTLDPAQVLLEPEGVYGDPPARGEAGEGTARGAGDGVAIPVLEPGKRTGKSTTDPRAGSGIGSDGDPMFTLQAGAQHGVLAFHHTQDPISGPSAPCLGAEGMGVLAFDQYNHDDTGTIAHTLRGGNVSNGLPAVLAFDTTQITSPLNRSQPRAGDPCHPLAATAHPPTVVAINNDSRAAATSVAAPQRSGYRAQQVVCATGEITHSLASDDPNDRADSAIVSSYSRGMGHNKDDLFAISTPPVSAAHPSVEGVRVLRDDARAEAVQRSAGRSERVHAPEVLRPGVHGEGVRREAGEGESVVDDGALPRAEDLSTGAVREVRQDGTDGRASQGRELAEQRPRESRAGVSELPHQNPPLGIPRRLTPREAERLMSWPDDWTLVPDEKGRPASDARRYKAIGNGVVSNVAQWIAARAAHFYGRAP